VAHALRIADRNKRSSKHLTKGIALRSGVHGLQTEPYTISQADVLSTTLGAREGERSVSELAVRATTGE
jgi:hypothetical protein